MTFVSGQLTGGLHYGTVKNLLNKPIYLIVMSLPYWIEQNSKPTRDKNWNMQMTR